MLYLCIFGLDLEKGIVIFEVNTLEVFSIQASCKNKNLKFRTKNVLFECFGP